MAFNRSFKNGTQGHTKRSSELTGAISAHFFIDLYTPVLPIILPFLMDSMGLSYFLAGLVVTVFNIVSSITQPIVGIWGDKTGKHANVAFCLILGTVGITLTAITSNYLILLMLVIGAAIGHALFHPAGMNLVYRMSPPAKLGRYNSLFTTAGSISYALGPLIAGALIAFGGLPAVCWMMLPGIIGAAWIYRLTKKQGESYADDVHDASDTCNANDTCNVSDTCDANDACYADNTCDANASVKKSVSNKSQSRKTNACASNVSGSNISAALVVIVCALRAVGYIGIITYLPTLLMETEKMSSFSASIVVTIMLFVGVAGQIAGGVLSDKFGRKRMLVLGLALAIPCFLLIFTGSHLMYLGIMTYAFFASFCYVTSVTMTQELLPGKTGLASGLTLGFTMGLGGLGAAAVGFIADISGSLTGALFLLIIPIIIAPVIALFVRYRKK